MRKKLELDLDTILSINEALARRFDIDATTALDQLHGSFTVKIVKGQFQLIDVSSSGLLIKRNRKGA